MDPMAKTLNVIPEDAFKGTAVASVQKDALAIVAASYEMRDSSRLVLSRLSSHKL